MASNKNNAPLKSVLFDLDGTLLDTAPDFIFAVNQLRKEENLAPLPDNDIRNTVSNGANALIELAFSIKTEHNNFPELRQRLLQLYSENLSRYTLPFPGIIKTLQFLKQQQVPWGVVTNKPEIYTIPLLQAMTFPEAPHTIICPEHVREKKPHPESLLLACQKLDCDPQQSLYLGDHVRDIQAGINANMPTIACTYGYIQSHEHPAQWQADHLIDDPNDINALLEEYYL